MDTKEREFGVIMGERIRQYRKKRRHSQHSLASEINVSRTSIANWEQGVRGLTVYNLHLVCKALDVSPDTLMNGEPIEMPVLGNNVINGRVRYFYHDENE